MLFRHCSSILLWNTPLEGGTEIKWDTSAYGLADDVNILEDNINITKKNTEALTDASKEDEIEVNAQKTKHMSTSCRQNAGQNHKMKTANRSFEDVAKFENLRTIAINQN
jgi:hypothetical protein